MTLRRCKPQGPGAYFDVCNWLRLGVEIWFFKRNCQDRPDVFLDLGPPDLQLPWTILCRDDRVGLNQAAGNDLESDLLSLGDVGAFVVTDPGAVESILDRQLLPIEEGIRRITHLPAVLLGIQGRGLIARGYSDADIAQIAGENALDLMRRTIG